MALIVDKPEEGGVIASVGDSAGGNGSGTLVAAPAVPGSSFSLETPGWNSADVGRNFLRGSSIPAAMTEVFWRSYYRQDDLYTGGMEPGQHTIRFWSNGMAMLEIKEIDFDGTWKYRWGTSGVTSMSGVYAADTWYKVEVYLKLSTNALVGKVQVWIDGTLVIDQTGATLSFGDTDLAGIFVGCHHGVWGTPPKIWHDSMQIWTSPGWVSGTPVRFLRCGGR